MKSMGRAPALGRQLQGEFRIIAAIPEPAVIEKILAHLGWIRSHSPRVGCARRGCTRLLEPPALSNTYRKGHYKGSGQRFLWE